MRSWRHPSEIAAGQRAAAVDISHEPYGLGDRWSFGSFVAGGAVGALLAVALVMSTGVLDQSDSSRVEMRPPLNAAGIIASTTMASGAVTSSTEAIGAVGDDDDGDDGPLTTPLPGVVTVYQLDGVTPVGTALHIGGRLVTSASVIGPAERLIIHHDGLSQEVLVRGRDQYSDIALLIPAEGDLLPVGSVAPTRHTVSVGDEVRLVTVDEQPQPIILSGQVLQLDGEVLTRDGHLILDTLITDARLPELAAGAALLNEDGEAIGMVIDCSDYLASAVPVGYLQAIADSIAETGWGDASWIGLVAAADEEGLAITEIVDDGPAALAGLATGDRLIAINGRPIATLSHFVMAVRDAGPGATVILDIDTYGHHWSTELVVGERTPVTAVVVAADAQEAEN